MFKKGHIVILVLMITLLIGGNAAFAFSEKPTIQINNEIKKFITEPIIYDDEVLVPFTEVLKYLGAEEISWNLLEGVGKGVLPQNDFWETKKVIAVNVREGNLTIGNNKEKLELYRQTQRDILLPAEQLGTALGYTVNWNRTTDVLSIKTGTGKVKKEYINVHFIDVGHGDAIYIQLPENNDILIDAGSEEHGEKVVEYLKKQNVDDIELLIATHPDPDHIGGIPAVLDAFCVLNILDNGTNLHGDDCFDKYEYKVKREGTNRLTHSCQVFEYPGASIRILTRPYWNSNKNENYVVAQLDCNGIKFLLPGDTSELAEKTLSDAIQADILKVPGHGENNAIPVAVLDKINPTIAVISTNKKFEEIKKAPVVKHLTNNEINTLLTSETGNIVIKTDGKNYFVKVEKY